MIVMIVISYNFLEWNTYNILNIRTYFTPQKEKEKNATEFNLQFSADAFKVLSTSFT